MSLAPAAKRLHDFLRPLTGTADELTLTALRYSRCTSLIVAVLLDTTGVFAQSQNPQPSPAPTSNASPQTLKEYGAKFVENALTDPIVALTAALLILAIVQFVIYRAEVGDTRLIERGWVSVTDIRLTNFGPNLIPSATVVYKNTGHTPANLRMVRLKLETMASNETLPPIPDYSDIGLMAYTTLMPNEEASSMMDYTPQGTPLAPFIYEGVQNGQAHLYLYGCMEYSDVFEPKKIRITRFARRYEAALSAQSEKPVFVFPKVAGYNEAT